MNKIERYRGCLLGLAIGDALGTTLEFKPPGTFTPITDLVGGGPFNLKPGEWTDDTSMALCLAESLIRQGDFDPIHQLETYCQWYRQGHLSSIGYCFDIGNTVLRALQKFEQTGAPDCGVTDPRSAGNGSLMRLAPVPLFCAHDPAQAIARAKDSSRTTHAAASCLDACGYFAGLLVGAVQGVSRSQLLAPRYSPLPGYWQEHPLVPEIDAIAAGEFKHRQPPEIKGTGYVVDALEAALWAFHNSTSFAEGCLLAVNLGNDADTTGAIFGQLAGAYYGESGIPQTWRSRLKAHDLIVYLAEKLARGKN
ncbi:ADP-ribosylglycohydrolase family protein [Phormidium sp. CCY1219]|uniref:ADP-ribosylglycohydrolase family protein n=1 Tax=Phormidium sp. CCY1219 TaxID=2886104 RepID=UPI002D1E5783|nr:ADP-ribosylglycohydrolase family protein [Phormidium sp. CCY1219]MEB3827269.1 ADP-ribosylglycohydrolase family protein [Phormidium sp. CCY1219]